MSPPNVDCFPFLDFTAEDQATAPVLRYATLPGLCVSFAVVGSRRHSSAPDVEVGSVVSREYLHIASTFFRTWQQRPLRSNVVNIFLRLALSAPYGGSGLYPLSFHLSSTCAVCAVHMAAAAFLNLLESRRQTRLRHRYGGSALEPPSIGCFNRFLCLRRSYRYRLQPHIYRRRPALAARATHTPQDYTACKPSFPAVIAANEQGRQIPPVSFFAPRSTQPRQCLFGVPSMRPTASLSQSALYTSITGRPPICAVDMAAAAFTRSVSIFLQLALSAPYLEAIGCFTRLLRLRRSYGSGVSPSTFFTSPSAPPGDRARPSLRWVPVATLPGLCVSFAVVGSRRHSSAPDVEVGSVVSREYLHIASTFFRTWQQRPLRSNVVNIFLRLALSAPYGGSGLYPLSFHLSSTCAVCAVHMAAAAFLNLLESRRQTRLRHRYGGSALEPPSIGCFNRFLCLRRSYRYRLQPHIYRRRPALAARATHTPQDYTACKPSFPAVIAANEQGRQIPPVSFFAPRSTQPRQCLFGVPSMRPTASLSQSALYTSITGRPPICAVDMAAAAFTRSVSIFLQLALSAPYLEAIGCFTRLLRLRRSYGSGVSPSTFFTSPSAPPGDRARPSLRRVPVVFIWARRRSGISEETRRLCPASASRSPSSGLDGIRLRPMLRSDPWFLANTSTLRLHSSAHGSSGLYAPMSSTSSFDLRCLRRTYGCSNFSRRPSIHRRPLNQPLCAIDTAAAAFTRSVSIFLRLALSAPYIWLPQLFSTSWNLVAKPACAIDMAAAPWSPPASAVSIDSCACAVHIAAAPLLRSSAFAIWQ
ncbi:hypothetical protein B0H16DRAFT_1710141 [Mycena metata]|uniref:Uncharacterized protein n=1 Tax=Mycena metata TaxID=1033252 RepID=A0AAD7P146_9AGAR|nr:hypothetical protein B0H16DRAFT_1710141 [Mycena metata]